MQGMKIIFAGRLVRRLLPGCDGQRRWLPPRKPFPLVAAACRGGHR